MSLHTIALDAVLAVVVFTCVAGTAGMWRMKQPIQALHYIALPASLGILALAVAVFLEAGNTRVAWKTVLIAIVVLAINAVVAHQTARAFRIRELGHWKPLQGDPFEFVRDTQEE